MSCYTESLFDDKDALNITVFLARGVANITKLDPRVADDNDRLAQEPMFGVGFPKGDLRTRL